LQIKEIRSETVVYVDKSILTLTGGGIPGTAATTISDVIVFRNLGLVGLFRLESPGGNQGFLQPLSGTFVPTSAVYPGYIVTGILPNGLSSFKPLRILKVDSGDFLPNFTTTSNKQITTADYLSNGSMLPNNFDYTCAIYSSRGLEDLSSVEQCRGVYGREVDVTANASSTQITLTTNVGVETGDFVQFDGANPVNGVRTSVPIISQLTTVTNVDSGGKIITINPGIRNSKALPKSPTLISSSQ
jgi:hypothetical protein